MSFTSLNMSQSSLIFLKTVLMLAIISLSSANSVCPSSAYLSASDAPLYFSQICEATVNTKYRLQGGASLNCSAGSANVILSDPNVLTQALCITFTTGGSPPSTSAIPIKKTLPPGCPADYIQATYGQALTYRNQICSALGQWDIVALQGGGSIRGSGYGCVVTQTETTGMGDVACVPRSYIPPATITVVNADENACSSCQSLITTSEVSIYYTSIPVGTIARIAGGSSVQRTSTSAFTIIDHDTVSRSSQICTLIPRAGCSTSSYLTSSCTCEACQTSCYTCSGPSYCDSCSAITGFPFSYNLLCYNPCPSGSYETSPSTCQDCSSNCFTCSGNADYCTSCNSASSLKYLSHGVCYATCPPGTYQASSSTCEDCSSNCFTCSGNADYCTSCNSASSLKYLSHGVCYATCPTGTYEASPSTCDDCSSNCFTCSGIADYCTNCNPASSSKYLSHGVCYATCPPGTYQSSSSTCDDCSSNCFTCSGTADYCTSCDPAAGSFDYLYQGVCYATCPPGTFAASPSTCENCSRNCFTCSGNADYCTSCNSLEYLSHGVCYETCPIGTYEASSSTCYDCSSNCFTCSGTADYCTSCDSIGSSSKYLSHGICYTTCPLGTFAASPSTCEDCTSLCKTCSSTSTRCTTCLSDFPYFLNDYCYHTCPDGFYSDSLTNTCLPCSNNCTTCLKTANTCTSCSSLTSTPFLYENKCFAQCPVGSLLTSSNICSNCSLTDKCTSNPGNIPVSVATSSSDLPRITKVFSKTSNIGFTIGAAFSSGPMAIFTGLLFKLIGYIKYLDITYPNNLEQAFQKWQSDIIPSVFPEMSQNTINKLKAKSIPAVYLERKVAPTFLENFWFSMLNLVISFFSLACIFLAAVYCKQKGKKNGEVILKYLLTGLVNFIIVQLYYHCGDILLFFILEARSLDFGSTLSIVSFCISIGLLSLAICTLTIHSFIVFRYTSAHKKTKISEFEEKYSHFKIIYEAFKCSSFLQSSYLLLFTLRDVALNLVIALLFEHTLAQAILFICLCVAFMSYLITTRPFKKTIENVGQCFFEALVLLTYIFALIIQCADANDWDQIKDRLGMGIIVIALIFSVVSTILMIFTLFRMCLQFYKEQAQRKAFKKIHILPDNSQTIQQNINVTNRVNLIKSATFLETHDSPRALDGSPVRSIRGFDKNEIVPVDNTGQTELSFSNNLSLAERIQMKRSLDKSSVRREKNRLELFNNNNSAANQQIKLGILQPDKSAIQEESDETSRSLSAVKFEKRDSSRLYTNQNQSHLSNRSNHPNSINLISYTKLPSNADSPENKFSKSNNGFVESVFVDSRVINFSPDKDDKPTPQFQKNS